MDDSGLEFEEMFWLSDAESMARIITDKRGRIESYHDPIEFISKVTVKEPRSLSSLKKLYCSVRYKLQLNSDD